MCSAVFITGYDVEFAAEHVGYFTAPYDERRRSASRSSTTAKKRSASPCPAASPAPRSTPAARAADLPEGSDKLSFAPKTVAANLPSAGAQDWPMGDRLPKARFPAELDEAEIKSAVDAAFSIPEPRRPLSSSPGRAG